MMAIISILFGVLLLSFNAIGARTSSTLLKTTPVKEQSKISFEKIEYTTMPYLKVGSPPYSAAAKSALIYDVISGKVIYSKNIDQSYAIASLTKLMTVLIIMQEHSPDETVIIPDNLPDLGSADQKINITPGEKFKLSELMKATLIYSANDVVNALAVWDSGSIEKFATKMNDYAKKWDLQNSHFTNPSGLDETGHVSSAQDLAKLSNILLHNNTFRTIINTQKATVQDLSGKTYNVTTTNQNLTLSYVYGIKTGFTENAGQSLVLLAQKNGHEIIALVLDSPDRFAETKNMVDYTFNNYIWK